MAFVDGGVTPREVGVVSVGGGVTSRPVSPREGGVASVPVNLHKGGVSS